MLISLDEVLRRYASGLTIGGVLHLGAHLGEEAAAYHVAGINRVVWVEAHPATVDELRRRVEPYGHEVIEAAVADQPGRQVEFFVASNRQSSSLLRPKTHLVASPEISFRERLSMVTQTVDGLAVENDFASLNMLNADLQGAELLALRGAERTLRQMDLLYLEVNTKELYEGCARLSEVDSFLQERDFVRVATRMAGRKLGWGDGVWVRQDLLKRGDRLKSAARSKMTSGAMMVRSLYESRAS